MEKTKSKRAAHLSTNPSLTYNMANWVYRQESVTSNKLIEVLFIFIFFVSS